VTSYFTTASNVACLISFFLELHFFKSRLPKKQWNITPSLLTDLIFIQGQPSVLNNMLNFEINSIKQKQMRDHTVKKRA